MYIRFKILLLTTILIVWFALLSGCTLNPFLDATETLSKGYGTVKNAQSLGKVADGVITLTETAKIKAKTSDTFVKDLGILISKQSLETQAKLISQSIEAKVSVEKIRADGRWATISSFWLMVLGSILVVKYLVDKASPTEVKKTY